MCIDLVLLLAATTRRADYLARSRAPGRRERKAP